MKRVVCQNVVHASIRRSSEKKRFTCSLQVAMSLQVPSFANKMILRWKTVKFEEIFDTGDITSVVFVT